jgi:hypothetical protein
VCTNKVCILSGEAQTLAPNLTWSHTRVTAKRNCFTNIKVASKLYKYNKYTSLDDTIPMSTMNCPQRVAMVKIWELSK